MCSGSHGRRNRTAGPAREGVRRVRSLPEGPKSEVDLVDLLVTWARARCVGGGCLGAGQRGALQAAGALRSPAARVREPVAQCLEAMGGRGSIEIRGDPGRERLAVTIADHGAGIPTTCASGCSNRTSRPRMTDGSGARPGAPDDRTHNGRITVRRRRAAALRSPSCYPPREPGVLLVDDEANIRKMVAALLESEGFETAERERSAA